MPTAKTTKLSHLQKNFGLDHLELYATFYDESIFEGLDFENSNYFSFQEYVGVKHEVPNYLYKIMFSNNNLPYFAYYKGKKVGNITHNDYVVFYSTMFRVEGLNYVFGTLELYFQPLRIPIRRFDICLDMIMPIEVIRKSIGKIDQQHNEYRGRKGKLETLYIGDKSSKNKRQLIRVYDKLLDISKKKKQLLYQDYIIHDDITRIEIEFRRELCRNITLKELIDTETQLSIFKRYISKHTDLFDFLSKDEMSLYKEPKRTDFDIFQSITQNEFRIKVFHGHARSLLDTGVCPVYSLIRSGTMTDNTKKVLTASCDMRGLQIRIERADYWVEEILSLVP